MGDFADMAMEEEEKRRYIACPRCNHDYMEHEIADRTGGEFLFCPDCFLYIYKNDITARRQEEFFGMHACVPKAKKIRTNLAGMATLREKFLHAIGLPLVHLTAAVYIDAYRSARYTSRFDAKVAAAEAREKATEWLNNCSFTVHDVVTHNLIIEQELVNDLTTLLDNGDFEPIDIDADPPESSTDYVDDEDTESP